MKKHNKRKGDSNGFEQWVSFFTELFILNEYSLFK